MSSKRAAQSAIEQARRRILNRPRAAGLALAGILAIAGAIGAWAPAALAQTETVTSFVPGEITVSGPDTIVPGTTATYTMTITDLFASPMSQIDAAVIGPLGSTVNSSPNCPAFRFGGGSLRNELSCNLPDLAPGQSESVTVTVSVPTSAVPGTVNLEFGAGVQVTTDVLGAEGGSVEVPVTVLPAPTDLQVTGSSNNGSPSVGSQFTYTFQVKNNGPGGASGVSFDDTLPAGVELNANGPVFFGQFGCNFDAASNSVHCDIGNLGVGQQVTIAVPAVATATGALPNTARVAMSGTDTRPDNNSVTVTVQQR